MVVSDNVLQIKSMIDTIKEHPLFDALIKKIVAEELVLINAFGRIHGSAMIHTSQEEMFFLLAMTGLIGDYVQNITDILISGKIVKDSDEEHFGCSNLSGNLITDNNSSVRVDIYNCVHAKEPARELSLIFAPRNSAGNPILIANINLPDFRIAKSDKLVIKDAHREIIANHSISSDVAWIDRCISTIRDLYPANSLDQFSKDLSEALTISDD